MKKLYSTPATTTISLRATIILAGSPANDYNNNQGKIRYSSTEVSANEAG